MNTIQILDNLSGKIKQQSDSLRWGTRSEIYSDISYMLNCIVTEIKTEEENVAREAHEYKINHRHVQLKKILRTRYQRSPIVLNKTDIDYFIGLVDGQVPGALKILDAIKKYEVIII